jgi:hypothetical protein
MTTTQLRAELTETITKIRALNESMKVLRVRHTDLKTRLAKARAAKNNGTDAS